jgi:hypothetical protein
VRYLHDGPRDPGLPAFALTVVLGLWVLFAAWCGWILIGG